jgi:hypothetical protein
MLEDIGKLEWVKSCVDKAKNICKFIYNHALVLSMMRQYTGQRELARLGITRFASNFLTLKSLLKSKASLRRMFVGEEWIVSSYATTTARMDVVDCIFDEPGFWTPCAEIMEVNIFLFSLTLCNFSCLKFLMDTCDLIVFLTLIIICRSLSPL